MANAAPLWAQPILNSELPKIKHKQLRKQTGGFWHKVHPSCTLHFYPSIGQDMAILCLIRDPSQRPSHFRCRAPVISLNQARAVGRGSCIASTTLALPRPNYVKSWCILDWMEGYSINPTRINKKIRLQPGLGMEHSSCSTRCTRWQLSQVGRPWHHIWGYAAQCTQTLYTTSFVLAS